MTRALLAVVVVLALAVPVSAQNLAPGLPSQVWVTPTFAAGNYTANGSMTWTVAAGDIITNRYMMLTPTTMVWVFNLGTTTVAGTPDTELLMAIPNGKRSPTGNVPATMALQIDNGTVGIARAVVGSLATVMQLFTEDNSNWAASTDNTNIAGIFVFEVEDVP